MSNRINQETLAGRFESFDTELPEQTGLELNRPRRPRILGRSKPATLNPGLKWPLYLAVFIAGLLIASTAPTLWRQQGAERAKTNKAISQPIAPQPTPQAITLPPGSASRWKEYLANNPPTAPRAVLVALPPPRAQLIRLPEWKVGETRAVKLSYGIEAIAKYKGYLDAEWMLPVNGNSIGDAWQVGDNLWVWLVAPGAARADWIDP